MFDIGWIISVFKTEMRVQRDENEVRMANLTQENLVGWSFYLGAHFSQELLGASFPTINCNDFANKLEMHLFYH